jgi:hypothetical protein
MTRDHNAEMPAPQTPTFDTRSAFSWTLRAGEAARLERRRRRDLEAAARCGTPTFDTRAAFSWTLRAGEVARVERRRRPGPKLPDVLVAC